jgi:hypothetical protein
VAILIAVNDQKPATLCSVISDIFEGRGCFADFAQKEGFLCSQEVFDSKSWNLSSTEHISLQRKIEECGVSLEKLSTKIRLGLATGNNDAFIIDERKRKELINSNPRTRSIIKPVLRGRDIFRYAYSPSGLYILLTRNEINVKSEYPEVYKHLDSFGDSFKKRGAKGKHWTNLRACAFFDDFKREKIIWIELSDVGRFALCSEEVYLLNSAYFMLPPPKCNIKYLLGILNSRIIRFYLSQIAETSGMGTSRWINNYVKEFPIATATQEQETEVVSLVMRIISEKEGNPTKDTSVLSL